MCGEATKNYWMIRLCGSRSQCVCGEATKNYWTIRLCGKSQCVCGEATKNYWMIRLCGRSQCVYVWRSYQKLLDELGCVADLSVCVEKLPKTTG